MQLKKCATMVLTVPLRDMPLIYMFKGLGHTVKCTLYTGFWKKTETFHEYPIILFKNELLMVAEFAGSYVTYNTFQMYNLLQQDHLRIPLVSQFVTLTMKGMAYLSHDNVNAGARYDVVGELRFNQKEPLKHIGIDNRYNTSVIDSTSIYAKGYHLPTIFKNYVARNLTTYLNTQYSVWSTSHGVGQPFVLLAYITYPELFLYTPGFWFLIKWGWVQYLSVLLIFLFVFDRVKVFIFENQLVTTMFDRPWKQRPKFL